MEAAPDAMDVSGLTAECLARVFSYLAPGDLAAAACTHKAWRLAVVQEEGLWRSFCEAEFSLTTARAPDRQPLPSFQAAFGAWRASFSRYGSMAGRALRAWRQVEEWSRENFPDVARSLRPGASEDQLDEAERQLGTPLCPALRVLYRVHDGQELEFDRQVDKQRTSMHDSVFHGMFGGYSFYSHLVSTRMLPLRRMVRWTRAAQGQLSFEPGDRRALFAASHNFSKMIYCDCGDGLVKIATVDKSTCLQAVPGDAGSQDGVLRWFEAYAAALSSGRFGVEPLDGEYPESLGICLFPQLPPWRAEAVTEGVRVRACPFFVPELTQISDAERQYFFTYSVRFALLPEEEQQALCGSLAGPSSDAPLDSVQLRSRHWIIRNAQGAVDSEVRGEAVVGHYPLLKPGAPDFSYQSCTHQREPVGSMEGSFRFVKGSLQHPRREFDVACAQFRLDVPGVVF